MSEGRSSEALEKLNRGIEESKKAAQQQTMGLAQEYFGDSVEALRQQIGESRSTLESLPDQVPGGQDEAFQMLFQELMENYATIEGCLEQAQQNVANLDLERLSEQGEVEATDAARREAQERGVDLTQIKGTGSDGRIIVSDVVEAAEAAEAARGNGEVTRASEAARRKAEELDVDISQVQGTGSEGYVTVGDVTSFAESAGGEAAQQATDLAGQTAEQVDGAAGQAAEAVDQTVQTAGETAQQATDQVQQTAGQATEQAGQVAGQATEQVEQAAGQTAEQAEQTIEQVEQTAEGATDQAQQTAGGALRQAQQTVDGAADQAAGQADQAGGQAQQADQEVKATNAARRKAEELGVDISRIEGSGAGGLVTVRDVIKSR